MFEFEEDVEEGEEMVVNNEDDDGIAICSEKADAMLSKVGSEVMEEEDPINFIRYENVFSDRVHLYLSEILSEHKLPYYELSSFQKVALHAIGSGRNTILISPTGTGKSVVVSYGILLLRKIKEKSKGVGIGTLPLSIVMDEKKKTSEVATAVLSLKGDIDVDSDEAMEPNVSKPITGVLEGEFPIIVGHPEAWNTGFGQDLVSKLKEGPGILLNFIDEAQMHGSDHWQRIRPLTN